MNPIRIHTILIANRGEIAVRIIKTVRTMGLRSVAVFSEADRYSPHVEMADDAIAIGGNEASKSYLAIDIIIEAALTSGADAIHPGYGFLSENADFVYACEKAGVRFIGPSAEAITIMGNKARAKQQMAECGVACVPGYDGENQGDVELIAQAKSIGYPVMVKAAAGGGGRGMRLVEQHDELPDALQQARAEAISGFGSADLILEKAILNARHIEIQVFGDTHGNLVHVGERDCSLQRRHQKVIEEAPSPAVHAKLREKMAKTALKAAKSVSYEGAGTVEFLLDADENFYFLEMNTRLQVEHGVSECVSGLDFVEWQIRIARGETLPLAQEDISLHGHAIQVRLYAENPAKDFMPSVGKIYQWDPAQGEGLRVDSGIQSGQIVTPYYDAMLAKVIVWSEDREQARNGLVDALEKTILFGPEHNKQFLITLLQDKDFANGNATTDLITGKLALGELVSPELDAKIVVVGAVSDFIDRHRNAINSSLDHPHVLANWSSSPLPPRNFNFEIDGKEFEGDIEAVGEFEFIVRCSGQRHSVYSTGEFRDDVTVDGEKHGVSYGYRDGSRFFVAINGRELTFHDLDVVGSRVNQNALSGEMRSPMPGTLVEILVNDGDNVTAGSTLAILEAMKMRHKIVAPLSGLVRTNHQTTGVQIAAGDLLFEIEPEDE